MELTDNDIKQLNAFENFLSFKTTWVFKAFINCPNRIIGLFTGNQYGKTNSAMYQYVLRVLGVHPIPEKNVLYFECPNYKDHDWVIIKLDGEVRPAKGTTMMKYIPP